MTQQEPDDSVSLEIAAPPDRLWRLVSDIRNMGRWSPETFRARWLRGHSKPEPGARFKGYNRYGFIVWGTAAEVEVAEPGREFTFTTILYGKPRTRWAYQFEGIDGGTRVTETRSVISNTWLRSTFQRRFMRGHSESFSGAMLTTLQRLKAAAEQGTV